LQFSCKPDQKALLLWRLRLLLSAPVPGLICGAVSAFWPAAALIAGGILTAALTAGFFLILPNTVFYFELHVSSKIVLQKRLPLRQNHLIPNAALCSITVVQTPLMRPLRLCTLHIKCAGFSVRCIGLSLINGRRVAAIMEELI